MRKFWVMALIATTFPMLMIVFGVEMGSSCIVLNEVELLWGIVFCLALIATLLFAIARNCKIAATEQEKQTLILKDIAEKTDAPK